MNGVLFSSVARTESVWMDSPLGEKVYGCLYHPKNPHPSRPIVIVFHGLSWTGTLDMRWPLELTKRGFYVLSVDQSGHGFTHGNQPGLQDDVLKPFFFRNVIGVVDYIYSRQDLFNISAIGCMGVSLGGWTTVMGTVVEPRINASVSLAGPTNITKLSEDTDFSRLWRNIGVTPENDFIEIPELARNHSAVEFWNGSYGVNPPKNLLLIQGTNDPTVNVSHTIDAYNLVNDSTKCDMFLVEGGDHALINNAVVNETIVWFETKLLGGIQGPIEFSQFTYIQVYFVYIMTLIGIYSSVFGVCFTFFKLKDKYIKTSKNSIPTKSSEEKTYVMALLKVILYSLPILGIWIVLYFMQGVVFNYLIVLLLGAALLAVYEALFFLFKSRDCFSGENLKQVLKSQFGFYDAIIAIACAAYFLGFYYSVAYYFKFLMISPQSIELYFLSLLAILPFFFSFEIFHRNLIQNQFPTRSERGKWVNRILLFGFAVISFFPFYYITMGAYMSVLIMFLFMIAVTTISIYLYEKTQKTFVTALFNSIVVAFFLAHHYFFFI